MIYEYVGLPGVGKSHLASERANAEQLPLIELTHKSEAWRFAARFFISKPLLTMQLCWYTCALHELPNHNFLANVRLLKHKLGFVLLRAMAREQKARTYAHSIIDEGVYQFVLAVSDIPLTEQQLLSLLTLLDSLDPRHICFVEAPGVVRQERLEKRGRSPRSHFGKDYTEQYYPVLEQNAASIKKLLLKHATDRVTLYANP